MERGKISLKYNAASADSRSYFISQSHCLSLTMSGAPQPQWTALLILEILLSLPLFLTRKAVLGRQTTQQNPSSHNFHYYITIY